VIFFSKPGAGMQALLQEGTLFKQTFVLDTVEPFIESKYLLSGAKSYSDKIQVQVPLHKLWVDVEEDSAAFVVLHRSVALNVYVTIHVLQRR